MIAEITEDGILQIQAESETELFALKQWNKNYLNGTNESRVQVLAEIKSKYPQSKPLSEMILTKPHFIYYDEKDKCQI